MLLHSELLKIVNDSVTLADSAVHEEEYEIPDECRTIQAALVLGDNAATAFNLAARIRKRVPVVGGVGTFDIATANILSQVAVGVSSGSNVTFMACNYLRISAQASVGLTSRFFWVIKFYS